MKLINCVLLILKCNNNGISMSGDGTYCTTLAALVTLWNKSPASVRL